MRENYPMKNFNNTFIILLKNLIGIELDTGNFLYFNKIVEK